MVGNSSKTAKPMRARFERRMAVHALRFASILVGAGLILRAGASERAMSAVDEDRSAGSFAMMPRHRAATQVLPQPAFGQKPALVARAATLEPGRRDALAPMKAAAVPQSSARIAVPTPESTASAQPHLAAIAPGLPAAPSATPSVLATSVLAGVAVAPAAAVLQPAPALAPAAQPAVRVTAPAAASPAPAPSAPAFAQPSAPAPLAGAHARPIAQSSDIETVLHSPASAWDYAEGVPDELRGAPAARQSYPAPEF